MLPTEDVSSIQLMLWNLWGICPWNSHRAPKPMENEIHGLDTPDSMTKAVVSPVLRMLSTAPPPQKKKSLLVFKEKPEVTFWSLKDILRARDDLCGFPSPRNAF